jgi:hypothetical protein
MVQDHDPGSSDELLVIVPSHVAGQFPAFDSLQGRLVSVTGTVRRLTAEQTEREYELELEPRPEAELQDQLILIAIDIVPDLTP